MWTVVYPSTGYFDRKSNCLPQVWNVEPGGQILALCFWTVVFAQFNPDLISH
jgi:hypothetical protein